MNRLAIEIIAILAGLIFVCGLPLNNKYSSDEHEASIEERSGKFEGDMVLNEWQRKSIDEINTRNGLVNVSRRWPNKIVPVRLSINHTKEQHDHIDKALRTLEKVSCITFVWHTNETDFIGMRDGNGGCFSAVGYQTGEQVLNLKSFPPEKGCFRMGTIIHEFLHALGFFHMQSSLDRDEHLKIEWKHIIKGMESNFNKYNSSVVTDFGVKYDYNSIMHYGAYAFTKDGYATIVPHNITYINTIGQRQELTPSDIRKLNLMYECTETAE